MLKMKVHNHNCKLKIDGNTNGIDVIVGICRLYVALMREGFAKKDIDKQVKEVLDVMINENKESESEK